MPGNQVKIHPDAGLIVPYILGPAIRRFSVPLLWQKQLIISAGAFITPRPFQHFAVAAKMAQNTPLSDLFNIAGTYSVLSHKSGNAEHTALSDLRDRVLAVAFVGSGTPASYQDLDPFLPTCLPLAAKMLHDTQAFFVAANAFVWRVYDTSLEFGAPSEVPLADPTPVLGYLMDRATKVGGPNGLLAECLLQRCASMDGMAACVTDSPNVLAVLAEFGKPLSDGVKGRDSRVHQLGFGIFDILLRPHAPLLEPPHTTRIAKLLDDRDTELQVAKAKCLAEAQKLLGDFPRGDVTKAAIDASLETMEEEIGAILSVDGDAVRGLFRRVTQDEKMWIALTGLLGSLIGTLPMIVPAAAAVTALSVLGANALKENRQRRDLLKNSPWKFAYHLRREG